MVHARNMAEVFPLPRVGDLFTDVRGEDRTLRVSCHPEQGLVVVSIWAGRVCRASFRLPAADARRLTQVLAVMFDDDRVADRPDPVADQPAGDQPAADQRPARAS
jgi:hypothetical protein